MGLDPQERDQQQRARARRLWGAVAALSIVAVAALWLLWGFRWPPTATVVTEAQEVDLEQLDEPVDIGDPVGIADDPPEPNDPVEVEGRPLD